MKRQPVKASVASFIGTMVEWYDYYIYGTASALIFGAIFFPSNNEFISTISSFATFAVGFLARPLGAVIFGGLGDKVGRKKSLLITISMMGVSTFLIGLLPGYASIGIWAPVLLILLRLIQGLAVGGEWGGAVLIAGEHAKKGNRTFMASFAQLGSPAGLIISILIFKVITGFDNDFIMAIGWRIPFLLSIVMLAIGLFIRLGISESPDFTEVKEKKELSDKPAKEVWLRQPKILIVTIFSNALGIAGSYFINTFMLSYCVQTLKLEKETILSCLFIAAIVQFLMQPVSAWASKFIGAGRMLLISSFAGIVVPYVMFSLVDTRDYHYITFGMSLGMIAMCSFYAVIAGYLSGIFPTRYRYTGISISYQFAGAVFGGFTPMVGALLSHNIPGSWMPLAIFFSVISLCSFLSVLYLETHKNLFEGVE